MKKKPLLWLAAVLVLFAAGNVVFYYGFVANWILQLYAVSLLLFGAGFALLLWNLAKRRRTAVLGGVLFAGLLFGIATFCRTAVDLNVQTVARILYFLSASAFILCFIVQKKKNDAPAVWQGCLAVLLCLVLSVLPYIPMAADVYYKKISVDRVASPKAGQEIAAAERTFMDHADLYVSPDGSDDNDGSFDHPLATVEKARDLARAMDKNGKTGITVALMAGEYRVSTLVFTAEDGGTEDCPVTYCAYGDGEVILNGGVTLPRGSFAPVTDDAILERLSDEAQENVLSTDLFSLGVTAEQYGKLYAIGGYHTASKYDGDWVGDIYCELFIDDVRQTIARYPNGRDYLYTGKVVFEGEGGSGQNGQKPEYETIRNPKPDVYKMDKSLSDRIASWKTLDDVWMFGYWAYDWADASTPVGAVDHENLTLAPLFVSRFVPKAGAPYYFFNVLEELDAPGEWYLDRESGMLYFWPPESFSDNSAVELSLSTDNIIKAEADHLIFDGLTVKGTRGDAVSISGNGNVVENCLIKNAAGNAILMTGYENIARNNEITRTGKGGVILDGGDRETLKPGNNRAENNLVHDWSEIYETYQPAFTLNGTGNVCAHNEMFNSPHEAITYSGNDHLIEYNRIHDVNLLTDDGGAIYSGRRWDWYGNVIRYNLIYDLGADGHTPVGIYMDDAIAGQTIYGNLIINAPNFGLQLGGGQDLDVHDNIVINSYAPISFDDRALRGLSGDESDSFYLHYRENGELWKLLWDSPWESDVWRSSYPQYAHYSDDFSNTDDPDFVLNPGHCTVTHNLLISPKGSIGDICDNAYKYSDVENNACFRLSAMKKLFVDPAHGDYTLRGDAAKTIGFEIDVPAMNEFGRR